MFNFFKKKQGFPPKKLRIKRMRGYHTHYLGKYEKNKLFFGDATFVLKEKNGVQVRTEFAVLYMFDENGMFENAEYWFEENLKDPEKVWYELDEMVGKLGKVKYQSIEVELFKTEIEGIEFGFTLDQEFETVNLQPGSTLSFEEPWDGEYYT